MIRLIVHIVVVIKTLETTTDPDTIDIVIIVTRINKWQMLPSQMIPLSKQEVITIGICICIVVIVAIGRHAKPPVNTIPRPV